MVGSVSEDASIKWELKGLQAAFGGTVTIAAVEAEFAGFRDWERPEGVQGAKERGEDGD